MDIIIASKILNLNYDDSLKIINKKYKNLLFKYHPDYNNNSESSNEFILLKESYDYIKELFSIFKNSKNFYELLSAYYSSKYYKKIYDGNNFINNDSVVINKYENFNYDDNINSDKESFKKNKNIFLSRLLISLSGLLYFIFLYNRVNKNNPLVNKNFWEYRIALVDWKKNSLFKVLDKAIDIYPYYSKDLFIIKNLVIDIFDFFKVYNNNNFPDTKFNGLPFILLMQLKKGIYTIIEQTFFTDLLFKKTVNRNLEKQRIKNILILFKRLDKIFMKFNLSEKIKDKIISDVIIMKDLINDYLTFRNESIVFPVPSDVVLTWYYKNL